MKFRYLVYRNIYIYNKHNFYFDFLHIKSHFTATHFVRICMNAHKDRRCPKELHLIWRLQFFGYILTDKSDVHGSVHRKYSPMYIQQDATLHRLLYLETALHVSGVTSTHQQERIQLYLQHLVFVTPLLLPAAIVEELELV